MAYVVGGVGQITGTNYYGSPIMYPSLVEGAAKKARDERSIRDWEKRDPKGYSAHLRDYEAETPLDMLTNAFKELGAAIDKANAPSEESTLSPLDRLLKGGVVRRLSVILNESQDKVRKKIDLDTCASFEFEGVSGRFNVTRGSESYLYNLAKKFKSKTLDLRICDDLKEEVLIKLFQETLWNLTDVRKIIVKRPLTENENHKLTTSKYKFKVEVSQEKCQLEGLDAERQAFKLMVETKKAKVIRLIGHLFNQSDAAAAESLKGHEGIQFGREILEGVVNLDKTRLGEVCALARKVNCKLLDFRICNQFDFSQFTENFLSEVPSLKTVVVRGRTDPITTIYDIRRFKERCAELKRNVEFVGDQTELTLDMIPEPIIIEYNTSCPAVGAPQMNECPTKKLLPKPPGLKPQDTALVGSHPTGKPAAPYVAPVAPVVKPAAAYAPGAPAEDEDTEPVLEGR